VDIFNAASGTWVTANLSQARWALAAATVNELVLFAGGGAPNSEDSAVVDIFHPCSSNSECYDSIFCNGIEPCLNGWCQPSTGNPCLKEPACNNTCNENAKNCFAPAQQSCSDGLWCSGIEQCNGMGQCVAFDVPCVNNAPCNNTCNENTMDCLNINGSSCSKDDCSFCDGAGLCFPVQSSHCLPHHPNTIAIVLGVIFGCVLVGGGIGLFVFWYQRRRSGYTKVN
jgi:hypothetical protein